MSTKKKIIFTIFILLFLTIMLSFSREDEEQLQHETWKKQGERTMGLDENGVLSTHLPILIIHNAGETIPGQIRENNEKKIYPYSIINNADGVNRSDDEPKDRGKALTSIRGNSSREYAKKQYLFKLVDETGNSEKKEMLRLPKESTWVLNGSMIDRSQIRNYFLYNLSYQIMGYAPRSRMCELMLEDENGKLVYMGLYTLSEKPKVSKNRLNLTKYDPSHEETSYLLQCNTHPSKYQFEHLLFVDANNYELTYPQEAEVTQKTMDYIQTDITVIEKKLFDASISHDWSQVEEAIDYDSFIDYFLINEFFQNYDAGRKSTYVYKNLGGKLQIGPVWDCDGALDNYVEREIEIEMLEMNGTTFYRYLMDDPKFVEQCIDRYEELRRYYLSESYLLEFVNETVEYLGDAPIRNAQKWYAGNTDVYYEDLEKIRTFIIERGEWMDNNFAEQIRIVN